MRELTEALTPADFDMGLYDSANGKSLATLAAVEVPDCECRTILLYTKAERGLIVQIVHPYKGQNYGSASHYHINELNADHWWIEQWARMSGITATTLMSQIFAGRRALSKPGANQDLSDGRVG